MVLQTLLAKAPILHHPAIQRAHRDVQLCRDGVAGEALLQEQFDRAQFKIARETVAGIGPARHPPRGVGLALLLLYFTLLFIHVNTPTNVRVSTINSKLHVSRSGRYDNPSVARGSSWFDRCRTLLASRKWF